MRTVISRSLPLVALLFAGLVAFGGFRFWQGWNELGDTFGGIGERTPERPSPSTDDSAAPEGGEDPRDTSDRPMPAGTDADTDPREEALALRRELSRVLVNDPELFASLDEMFDEPDEELLRENLTLLREAFLTESPQ